MLKSHDTRICLLALILVLPLPAQADTGLPMLAVVWPLAWFGLIPVALIESLIYRRVLSCSAPRALGLSALTNLASTAVGIPLAWGLPLVPEFALPRGCYVLPDRVTKAYEVLLWPFWLVPWEDPDVMSWSVLLALGLLLPLFFVMSVVTEGWLLRRLVSPEARPLAMTGSFRANCWSYAFLGLLLLIVVLTDAF